MGCQLLCSKVEFRNVGALLSLLSSLFFFFLLQFSLVNALSLFWGYLPFICINVQENITASFN